MLLGDVRKFIARLTSKISLNIRLFSFVLEGLLCWAKNFSATFHNIYIFRQKKKGDRDLQIHARKKSAFVWKPHFIYNSERLKIL